MMYRLGYDRTVTFCTLLDLSDLPRDADLSRLDWEPTEVPLDEERLRLALRDARATPEGIVFPAYNWSARRHLDDLGDAYRDAVGSRPQRIAQANHMEQAAGLAGYGESQRQDEADADAGVTHVVAKLRREVDEVLAQPIPEDVRAACQAHGLPVD